MDQEQFAARVQAEGYGIVTREVEPGFALPEHHHDWDAKGLVLGGSFTIGYGGESRTYAVGEVFALAKGTPHTESAGPEGARLVVARRPFSG